MSTERLARLYAAATESDDLTDWQALWQALAGSGLILPLKGQLGELVQPQLTKIDGVEAVEVFADIDSYADQLEEPSDYAEMDGAQLASMAASLDMPLAVKLADGQILIVPRQQSTGSPLPSGQMLIGLTAPASMSAPRTSPLWPWSRRWARPSEAWALTAPRPGWCTWRKKTASRNWCWFWAWQMACARWKPKLPRP